MTTIPGYTYDSDLPPAPYDDEDLSRLLEALLWSDDDAKALRRAGEALEARVEEVLDVWYGYVGSHPHLLRYFHDADGNPSQDYLAAVRTRFGRWIGDLCGRDWDDRWLAYQQEIARRHTTAMGSTDAVATSENHIPLRYMIAFIWPITATVRPFLVDTGASPSEVDAMHAAWFKAVTLTVVLWSQPYGGELW